MQDALTFDDVLLVPQYTEIRPSAVKTETKFSRNVPLKIPLVSSPMDTVTEHKMAIAMALSGGLGIIHKNLTTAEQVEEVKMVKRFENGFIIDPITVSQEDSISRVYKIRQEKGIKKIPVLNKRGQLVGLVTNLDYFWPDDKRKKVRNVMTKVKDLVTAPSSTNLDRANDIICKKKLSILCLIEKNGKLASIVTRKDLEKNELYPNSNKDSHKRLRVGAALGFGEESISRAQALVEAGVDVIVVDTAYGHSKGVIDVLHELKKDKITKSVDVVVGNVATTEAVEDLIKAGADGIKVGIGPGSICTTRVVAGVGVPQITAVIDSVAGRAKNKDVPICADGGIKYSGDIAKAIAVGADCVMIGGLFAGTEEAPGDTEFYNGKMYKTYRGMGSIESMKKGSKDRYGQASIKDSSKFIPEGIEGRLLYRGPVDSVIYQLEGGLRGGMAYTGAKNIPEFHKKVKLVRISSAGLIESHPHDVEITKEAPNYVKGS